ncbi:hypothetical protein C1I98_24410 [Spongiactinospora gelatinilytica]|uniref:Uncharacterized protein n=1 Tax=Spongiactinospora gelatinilytica TaxID=2666298 RepID=A0A2W2FR56_9ACTN|nr:hypothetical protein C1I98_24410 [Spongiactinospora gelatinilytica]
MATIAALVLGLGLTTTTADAATAAPAPAHLGISLTPTSGTVSPGGSTKTILHSDEPVDLISVSGAPPGVTVGLSNPNPIYVVFYASPSAAAGLYVITFRANGSSANYRLIITTGDDRPAE